MRLISISILFLFFLACSKEDRNEKARSININSYENYVTELREAPIYLYCRIDELLDSETRALICNDVHGKSEHVPLELSFDIRDKKVENIGVITMHLNSSNIIELYESGYPSLEIILKKLTYSEIAYNGLKEGSYLTRIQLEKFCYTEF